MQYMTQHYITHHSTDSHPDADQDVTSSDIMEVMKPEETELISPVASSSTAVYQHETVTTPDSHIPDQFYCCPLWSQYYDHPLSLHSLIDIKM